MAQRGLSAALRFLLRNRPPRNNTPTAPADSLSDSPSASSADDDLLLPDLPAPPPAAATPAAAAAVAPVPAPPPANTANNNNNNNNNNNETPSSQYSLRPRPPRRQQPDPPGADTSVARDPVATLAVPGPPPRGSSRPSRAAAASSAAVVPDPTQPRLPAPSARTTSAIAGRPDLLPVSDLDAAPLHTLRVLARRVAVSARGDEHQLRDRLRAHLAHRTVLNEDTVVLDADGKPRLPKPSTAAAADTSTAAAAFGPVRPIASRVPAGGPCSPPDRARGFDLTTTTVDTPRSGPVAACSTPATAPVTGHKALSGPFVPHTEGSMHAKYTPPPGPGPAAVPPPAPPAASAALAPALDLPFRSGSVAGMTAQPLPFRTHSSTGIGIPLDMPPSPAPMPTAPNVSATLAGWPPAAATAAGVVDPANSVDARGGNQQTMDMQAIFQDLSGAGGSRNLSAKEYAACLNVLNDSFNPLQQGSGGDAAALAKRRAFAAPKSSAPRTPATAGAKARNGATAEQMQTQSHCNANLQTAGFPHSARASSSANPTILPGSASALRPPQIPPAPPNTPGLQHVPPLSTSGRKFAGSSTVHAAADVLRASGGSLDGGEVQIKLGVSNAAGLDVLSASLATGREFSERTRKGTQQEVNQRPATGGKGEMPPQKEDRLSVGTGEDQKEEGRRGQGHNVSIPAAAKRAGEFTFDLNTTTKSKEVRNSSRKNNPLRGIFAGAYGGPGAHNTIGPNGVAPGLASQDDDRPRDDVVERNVAAAPHTSDDIRTPATGMAAGETRERRRLATPRDIWRSFNNRDSEDMEDVMKAPSDVEQNERPLDRDDPSPFHQRRARPFSTTTPASLPRHLRGFSAMGTLGGTPTRPRDSGGWPETPGRVVGPSSFRPRRPLSTSAGGTLIDLRNSTAAYDNTFIAEKMRRRGSSADGSPMRASLPKSTVVILDRLKKAREEHRQVFSKKRNVSPTPVPPSAVKRARRHGSFSATPKANSANAVTEGMQSSGAENGTTLNSVGGNASASDTRQGGLGSVGRSRPASSGGRSLRPIAFGIGKKRSKPAPISKAAVAQMKAFLDSDKKGASKELASGSSEPKPQFTFGEQFRNATPQEKKSDPDNIAQSPGSRTERATGVSPSAGFKKSGTTPTEGPPRQKRMREREPGEVSANEATRVRLTNPGAPEFFPIQKEQPPSQTGPIAFRQPPSAFQGESKAQGFGGIDIQPQNKFSGFGGEEGGASKDAGLPFSGFGGEAQPGTEKKAADNAQQLRSLSRDKPASLLGTSKLLTPVQAEAKNTSEADVKKTSDPNSGVRMGEGSAPLATGSAGSAAAGLSFGVGAPSGNPTFSFGQIPGPEQKLSNDETEGSGQLGSEKQAVGFDSKGGTDITTTAGKTIEANVGLFGFGQKQRADEVGKSEAGIALGSATQPSADQSVSNVPVTAEFKAPSAPLFPSSATSGASGSKPSNKGESVGHLSTDNANAVEPTGAESKVPQLFGTPSHTKTPTIPSDLANPSLSSFPLQEAKDKKLPESSTEVGVPSSSAASLFAPAKPVALNTGTSFGSSPSLLHSQPPLGASGPGLQTSNIFGAGVAPAAAASTTTPFVFGGAQSKDQGDDTAKATVPGEGKTPDGKDSAKPIDAMNTAATPPNSNSSAFAGSKSFGSATRPGSIMNSSGPLFGQPAAGPGVTGLGTGIMTTASAQSAQPGFSFGSTAPNVAKDPTGPFGGPQFGSAFTSAPSANTFVFGKSAAQEPSATGLGSGGSGPPASSGVGGSSAIAPFTGFQKPAIPFGSSQPAFSATPQFGTPATASASETLPFGSLNQGTNGVNGVPFGSSQPALGGGASIFASQPGLLGAPAQGPQFGSGGAPGPASTPAFGFGNAPNGQSAAFNAGGGFGSGPAPLGQPASSQPGFRGSFGAPAFGAGAGGGSDDGAFSAGAAQPFRRRPKLRGRRTFGR